MHPRPRPRSVLLAALALPILVAGCGDGGDGRRPIVTVSVQDNAAGGRLHDRGEDAVRTRQGIVYVAGSSSNPAFDLDMTVWAFDRGGAPLRSFGNGGHIASRDPAGVIGDDVGLGVALDAAGRILVCGTTRNPLGNEDLAVWRLRPDGRADESFGIGGVVVRDGGAGGLFSDDRGRDLFVDGFGRAIVVGDSRNSSGDRDMVVWAFDPEGRLDPSFGSGGTLVSDGAAGGPGGDDAGLTILPRETDGFLVAGTSGGVFGDGDATVWAFYFDGFPDLAFGVAGVFFHDNAAGGAADDVAASVTPAPGRRWIACGWSETAAGDTDMVLWRLTEDGELDPGFGIGGVVTHDFDRTVDAATDVVVTPYERIVVAGWTGQNTFFRDVVVWEYLRDGSRESLAVQNGAAGGRRDDFPTAILANDRGGTTIIGSSENRFGDYDMVLLRRR